LDLFYRLSVFTITLPALNERKGDVELLANYFLKDFSARDGRKAPKMDEEFTSLLSRHNWKGNIRELKNVMERVTILADSDTLTADLLPPDFKYPGADHNAVDLATIERQHIQKILARTHGNKAETARLLGIGVTTLYRKLDEYKIS
jgi:two-component system, NtrC family, response regulator